MTLHNALAEKTGLLFQEQVMAPDTAGVARGRAARPTRSPPRRPGTYLYEASPFVPTLTGGGSQYQTAMGMSGALVVRPDRPQRAYAEDESDTLTVTATGGTFSLVVDTMTVPAVPFDATGAQITSLLTDNTVSGHLDPGDVTVTGAAGGPHILTFGGALAGKNVTVTADGTGLEGAGAAVTVAEVPGKTAFDTEHLVVMTELDKDITAANAATFDMRDYAPEYFLVNGKASPQTDDLAASAGDRCCCATSTPASRRTRWRCSDRSSASSARTATPSPTRAAWWPRRSAPGRPTT